MVAALTDTAETPAGGIEDAKRDSEFPTMAVSPAEIEKLQRDSSPRLPKNTAPSPDQLAALKSTAVTPPPTTDEVLSTTDEGHAISFDDETVRTSLPDPDPRRR